MHKAITLCLAFSMAAACAAQGPTYLWTAGNSISSMYNVDNHYNQYQDPWPYTHQTLVPLIREPQGWKYADNVGGYYMALDGDGRIWTWSTSTNVARSPIPIPSVDENQYRQVHFAGSVSSIFGLRENGTLYKGTTEHIEIEAGDLWQKMASTATLLCALRSDGTVWQWQHTQATGLATPAQLATGHTWTDIATTAATRFGIREDGTLWALYPGAPLAFWQEGTDNDWAKIFAGPTSLFAIKTDGTLWAQGTVNSNGQLGIGTTSGASTFTQVGTDNDWDRVFPGSDHCFGLKTDGTLFGWGKNDKYQLGDGTNVKKLSPVQIGEEGEWTLACPGSAHSCFARTWGYSGDASTGLVVREAAKFNVYPVPARSYITVSDLQAGSQVTIIDPAGRSVRTERTDRSVLTMHTQELTEGLYLLRVETAQGQVTTRPFVIQR